MVKACVVAAVLVGCQHEAPRPVAPPLPLPAQAKATKTDQVVRGEYVAQLAGCTACHGHNLAGGDAPNITPDRETGIGAWTDAQIVAAIRAGVRPGGEQLTPLMPYPYYNRMTDTDALELVAYLRAQPAIHNAVAHAEHSAQKPIAMTQPRGNVDRVEDLHAHGEYLASLMHCGACHTPVQGPFAAQTFAGGMTFGNVVASNITPDRDSGIGSWTDDDIIRAVRDMKDSQGQPIRAPMANYRDAWSHLTDADARALVFFLRSVPPVHHDITSETPSTVSERQ